jgi:hypothetical protein
MKTKLLSLFLILNLSLIANANKNKSVLFKITHYNSDGQIVEVREKALKVTNVLDLEFYRTNFGKPFHFPMIFVNKKYKSQSVEFWKDKKKPKDINSNWFNTYYYDSLSRVTIYSYSGCLICSQQAFDIKIKYDQFDRPITLLLSHSFNFNFPENEKYELSYDNKNNIILLKCYSDGKFITQFERM